MVTADQLNQGAIQPIFQCEGISLERDRHGHVCSGCFMIWNCSSFGNMDANEPLCCRCASRLLAGDPKFEPEKEPVKMWRGTQPRPRIIQVALDCANAVIAQEMVQIPQLKGLLPGFNDGTICREEYRP
jgi:hypothetical protein